MKSVLMIFFYIITLSILVKFWKWQKVLVCNFKKDILLVFLFLISYFNFFSVFFLFRGTNHTSSCLVQIFPFWPKIDIWAYIFKMVHWILLTFGIDTSLLVFIRKTEVCSPGKIWLRPSCTLLVQILPFLASNKHFS